MKDKHCLNCQFVDQMPLDKNNIGQPRAHFCRFSPPHMVTLPTPQGLSVNAAFPVVTAEVWCHQYKRKTQ